MILQALYQLAERERLMEDPDFEWKPVAWLIVVGEGGSFLGIRGTHSAPTAEEGAKKKPKPRAASFPVPREPGRTSGDRAFFLFDKAEYALGQDPAAERPPDKLVSRFALFCQRAEECLAATGDEGVRAVCDLLGKLSRHEVSVQLPEGCASNDLFAFVYAKDVDRLITSRPAVQDYWRSLRVLPTADSGDLRLCLVSGRLAPPVDKLPGIKNLPGGSTSGVALVSFNSNAFESYGWEGNENAPISRTAAEACSTALNRLLHPAFPNPAEPGQSLPKRHLRLSADTVVCFWAATPSGEALTNLVLALLDADPSQVEELYRSVWRGEPVKVSDTSAFYALTLSGSQGRAIVRDWFESTVDRVAKNLSQHFSDLLIVRNTPQPKGKEHPPALPLRVLLRSLAVNGDDKKVPAALAGQVVQAALSGTLYPLSLLQRALERYRAEIGESEWSDFERRDARAALIKAVLNRRRRLLFQSTSYPEVTEAMDPNNTQPGYLLGRLMAVIERMQATALGSDVNASVVDRFFGAASATPGAVFPRLMKNFRHHARKAKDGEKAAAGWAVRLEKEADGLLEPLKTFPSFLALDQQGLFILGYHHQRHSFFQSKEDRQRKEAEAAGAAA
ncbi:MAG TPA: type I-C CRISPR-associated protein Cas8c/Csd1 [Thermoanaerobaculia bacterium]|jgi:CRISPR-associated protein Csd1|nr:type I-C CRISPR-associated protein Cas8c/Csd1 [Thermoanaerobaculia bacterium]